MYGVHPSLYFEVEAGSEKSYSYQTPWPDTKYITIFSLFPGFFSLLVAWHVTSHRVDLITTIDVTTSVTNPLFERLVSSLTQPLDTQPIVPVTASPPS